MMITKVFKDRISKNTWMKDHTKKFSYAASAGSQALGKFFKKVTQNKKAEEKTSPVRLIGQVTLDSFKKLKKKVSD